MKGDERQTLKGRKNLPRLDFHGSGKEQGLCCGKVPKATESRGGFLSRRVQSPRQQKTMEDFLAEE